jgi:iron-sulfur cluster repair protein YtfE (RIC family)
MLDGELVQIADDFTSFSKYVDGIDSIDGQTFDLISQALKLESGTFTDSECISIIESIIKNYHEWHRVDAGKVA